MQIHVIFQNNIILPFDFLQIEMLAHLVERLLKEPIHSSSTEDNEYYHLVREIHMDHLYIWHRLVLGVFSIGRIFHYKDIQVISHLPKVNLILQDLLDTFLLVLFTYFLGK